MRGTCSMVDLSLKTEKMILRVPSTSKLRANLSPKIHPSPSKVPREHCKRTLVWEGKPLQRTLLHINQPINRLVVYQDKQTQIEKKQSRRVLPCATGMRWIPSSAKAWAGYTSALPVRPTTTWKNFTLSIKIRLHFPHISNTASWMVEVRGKIS